MSSVCQLGSPPQAELSRQRMLQIVASAVGRIGHDLLGLTVPLRAVLEAAAEDGVEVSTAPEACRLIERLAAGMQMLAATERMSVTAELGAVYETIEPLLKGTLPRGVQLVAELDDAPLVIPAGRESVAQALFRCCHAVAAPAVPGDKVVVRRRPSSEAGAIDIHILLETPEPRDAAPAKVGAELLPRHDDPLIGALGASIEVRPGEPAPTIVLTVPLAQ
jgi:hypothetical protein